MFITLSGVLSADVANNGTFQVSLPTNSSGQTLAAFQASFPVTGGDFHGAFNHRLNFGAGGNQIGGGDGFTFPQQFDVTLAASTATITNKSGSTWKAGTGYRLQLEMQGFRYYQDNDPNFARKLAKMAVCDTFIVNLGSPVALSATGVAAAQAVAAAGNLNINGGVAAAGVAYLDVPRNVTVVSSNAGDTTQVATVYGTDQYGAPLRESITFNGTTTVQGNKAFLTVSRVALSGSMAGNASVGFGNKLGLPVFLQSVAYIVKEVQDDAVATAGTTVGGLRAGGGSTATTGDVRGTYTPNSAPDGTKTYKLILALPDPGNLGAPQFNG